MSAFAVASSDERAFSGLRVVDLSQGVAGPHCGMLFAQHGADVIKVEPTGGDWGRAIGLRHGDFCAYNIAFNLGKRSLAIDLKSPDGHAAVRQLMTEADVVIENYRPGVLARFELDYAHLKEVNPDVVFVSVTGYGQTGPRSGLPATDSILQSFSGLMTANKDARGMPQRVGVLVIDVVTGLYGFQGAATALYKRAMRGGGRHVQVSLMESIGAVQAAKMIEFHLEGPEGQKPGVPVGTFQTADGFITVNARRDNHFLSLCKILELDGLEQDERYQDMAMRADHEESLMAVLSERIAKLQTAPFAAALQEHDILHATVNDYQGYFDDPHVADSGVVQWARHADVGDVPLHEIPGMPLTRDGHLLCSPGLGQHSADVLREVGWTDAAIDAAVAAGQVVVGPPAA
ncbi:MAG: CoA transferase [Pseudomonadota bacterium]